MVQHRLGFDVQAPEGSAYRASSRPICLPLLRQPAHDDAHTVPREMLNDWLNSFTDVAVTAQLASVLLAVFAPQ